MLRASAWILEIAGCLDPGSNTWDSSSIIPVQKIALYKILNCPLAGVGVLAQGSLPFLATRGSDNVLRNLICALGAMPYPGIASLVPAITHSKLSLWLLGSDEVCTLDMQHLWCVPERKFWRVSAASKPERV